MPTTVTLSATSLFASTSAPMILPSRIFSTVSAAAATSASWVTRTMVWPPECRRLRSSITSWPPAESRAPVGSSANKRVGSLASARAMARRWRWPPDSTPGMAETCSPIPSRSSRSAPHLGRFPLASRDDGRQGNVLEHLGPRADPALRFAIATESRHFAAMDQAMACATGIAAHSVTIFPFRSTRSAGSASAVAAKAKRQDTRIPIMFRPRLAAPGRLSQLRRGGDCSGRSGACIRGLVAHGIVHAAAEYRFGLSKLLTAADVPGEPRRPTGVDPCDGNAGESSGSLPLLASAPRDGASCN